jgi:hypothetical protein
VCVVFIVQVENLAAQWHTTRKLNWVPLIVQGVAQLPRADIADTFLCLRPPQN